MAVSAQSGQRIESIWEAVLRSYRSASQKLASSTVHEAIEDAILYSPPPRLRNRAGRYDYFVDNNDVVTQGALQILFCHSNSFFPTNISVVCQRSNVVHKQLQALYRSEVEEGVQIRWHPD